MALALGQPKAMAASEVEGEDVDPKTALNHFCQRYAQRPVTKSDIVYTVNRFGQLYQAIVTLHCVNGEQYAGESQPSPKEAERAAAHQAVLAHKQTLEGLPPALSKDVMKKKRGRLTPEELAQKRAKDEADKAQGIENPALTPKVRLNTLCMKIAHTFLKKGETTYECRQVIGGFQATVKLSCLPGEWGTKVWAGEVCTNKQKAEQSAAGVALEQVTADAELNQIAAGTRSDNAAIKAGGKGKMEFFKGKMGKGAIPPWMWGWAWDMGGGKGKGKGPSGPDLSRERLTEAPVSGEVVEWKGKYGWVKPQFPFDHPAAQHRGGKLYVSQQDISGVDHNGDGLSTTLMHVGRTVHFHIYLDPNGLGAEDVDIHQT